VASAEQLRQLMERPLGEVDVVAVMIDGIHFHDYVLVVALGIDAGGHKHVLGMWPGATENADLCQTLLQDLIERGLSADKKYLFVLDGAKALAKAVRSAFGKRAEIQRCQEHKERNVLSHLPEKYHAQVRARLRAALGLKQHADAQKALQDLEQFLEDLSGSAAASLREGQEELLTVHRLGMPEKLRRTLRSTNPIESCFSAVRDRCRNVKRWRSEEMAQRWAGTMLLEVQRRCRRLKGYREMPVLLAALRGTDRIQEVA
jgi:transposase-like protein